jgi:hypothetical protein
VLVVVALFGACEDDGGSAIDDDGGDGSEETSEGSGDEGSGEEGSGEEGSGDEGEDEGSADEGEDEGATDDGTATDGATDGADEPCENGTGPCETVNIETCGRTNLPCFLIASHHTCHNFRLAGGRTDDRIFGQVFNISAGAQVLLYVDVTENLAQGAPDTRTAEAVVAEDGSVILVAPAYGEGEEMHPTNVFVDNVQLYAGQFNDFPIVVAPLDDPTTECAPLPE